VVATISASDVLRLHAKLPKLGLKLIQRMAKVCAAKEMHFLMEEAGLPKLKGKTLVDRVVRAARPFLSVPRPPRSNDCGRHPTTGSLHGY
jgi:hypothetical protein